jgi:hypothetical protein
LSVKYIYEIAKIKKEADPDFALVPLQSICKVIYFFYLLDDCKLMQFNGY